VTDFGSSLVDHGIKPISEHATERQDVSRRDV
jgi:hypothetical protein